MQWVFGNRQMAKVVWESLKSLMTGCGSYARMVRSIWKEMYPSLAFRLRAGRKSTERHAMEYVPDTYLPSFFSDCRRFVDIKNSLLLSFLAYVALASECPKRQKGVRQGKKIFRYKLIFNSHLFDIHQYFCKFAHVSISFAMNHSASGAISGAP